MSPLRAAVEYARAQGGSIVEGYPVRAAKRIPDAWAYTGQLSAFLQAGFVEVARPSESRSIVRFSV